MIRDSLDSKGEVISKFAGCELATAVTAGH
jgi:hypothetical protein